MTRPRRWAAGAVVVALVALLLGAAPAGAQDAAGGLTAAELDGQVLNLAIERDQVVADLDAGRSRRAELEDAIARGNVDYRSGLDLENATHAVLGRYSVGAYMLGSVVPPALTDHLLTSGTADLDAEGRRVLATTVHAELTGQARQASQDLDEVVARLDRDEAEAADLDRRMADLDARRTELESQIATTKSAADRAHVEEARQAAEAERRSREEARRAATPRPVSVHSGVVPRPTVPDPVVAKFGGEISRTALDAYYRAAALTAATNPGCGIDWALIGAIGKVETGHATYRGTVLSPDGSTEPTILGIPLDGSNGTLKIDDTDGGKLDGDPIADRAVGPMQFIPGTWRAYAVDGNGDGIADPHNLYDSALAAATYLCRSGGASFTDPATASRAVYAYNRSSAYNLEVLTIADRYRHIVDPSLPSTPPVTVAPPDPVNLPPPASPEQPILEPPPDPDPTSTTTTTVPDSTTTTTEPP